MKVISRSIKVFFIIFALVVLALLVFVASFDANHYKPQIIEQVEQATGRDFSIEGDINLSLFPWIGLTVDNVTLGNARGFEQKYFAEIKQLDVKINVLPLLKKEVQINTVRLHGLKLALEVASNGANNWSSLSQQDQSSSEPEDVSIPAPTPASVSAKDKAKGVVEESDSSLLQALNVEGFEFVDAAILYDDRNGKSRTAISALNLTTGAIAFDEPVAINFSARIENDQPKIDTRLKLSTLLTFNKALTEFSLDDFVFTVFTQANEFITQDEQVEIKSSIDVSLDDERILVKNLQLSALGITTQAELSISQFLQTPVIQGMIDVKPFDARDVAKRAGVTLPPMAKGDAMSKVALTTTIKLQGEKLQVNDLKLTLDDSTLTGWLHLLNISKQQLRYELAFDQLNINDYLPPVVESVSAGNAAKSDKPTNPERSNETATAADEKIVLPLELLRQLDVQGEFRVASLVVKEYDIKQLFLSLKAKSGLIAIKPVSMQVLQGQVDADVDLNVQKKTPVYVMKLKLDQVQAGPVVNPFLDKVMGDKSLTMEGAITLSAAIKTSGDSVNQLKKASRGKVVFDMKETRVDGFDPEFYMRSSIADYVDSKGFGLSKTLMGQFKPRQVTVFDEIHSTVEIADGKARTEDFLMNSKRVKVTAKGYADIMQDTVDVLTSIQLPRSKTAIEKIFNEPVFVRVHGPFDALEYKLDSGKLKKSTTDVFEKEAKAKLAAEKQRAKDKAKEKVKKSTDKYKDKLKDKLKNLF